MGLSFRGLGGSSTVERIVSVPSCFAVPQDSLQSAWLEVCYFVPEQLHDALKLLYLAVEVSSHRGFCLCSSALSLHQSFSMHVWIQGLSTLSFRDRTAAAARPGACNIRMHPALGLPMSLTLLGSPGIEMWVEMIDSVRASDIKASVYRSVTSCSQLLSCFR